MAPHGYALRSRATPQTQDLQNEATCKDHKPAAAAPKLVAGPSTAKLPSPSVSLPESS